MQQRNLNTFKPMESEHLRVWSKLPTIRRCPFFGGLVKIFNFLNFLPFSLLYQDMQIFSDKKGEEIGFI